ncbi:MAG: sodium/solute symporter [Nitrososphaera sp.]|jgi:SSS family transporter
MTVLSEEVGYFILLGVGLIMALVVTLLVRVETKWLGTRKTFEWFSTAGRNIKVGLLASSVVSAWTWAATLLQSSTVAYQFGVSGPFWYAAGASIQVVLFAIIATELKRKAPSSHTFPEIIFARFGKNSHKVFLFFALMTNTIVTAMLVLGGAAAVSSLTGINIFVAAFLIPIGVVIYTFFGGLKATFLAEYMNTVFLFIVVLVFVSVVYFANPQIGGISGMFNKLSNVATFRPVEGNFGGSYLTLASTGALIFGVINIIGNFGTVFVDQAYWQRAVAAGARSVFKGFLVGGLAWFAIPFSLATTLGLAAIAINLELTPDQISMGLVAPSAATSILGDIGAILILTILFTAVTAAGSAELVAVSSLVTYDVYRTYVKPSSTGRELMRVSRLSILGFGIGMGVLALLLLQVGMTLQHVYLAMGVMIGSAVAPIALAVVWKKTSKVAATAGALGGLVCGLVAWIWTAYVFYGEVSIYSTGQMLALLAGNITAIGAGAAVTIIGSIVKPSYFDFSLMKQRILFVDGRFRGLDGSDDYLKRSSKSGYKIAIILTLTLVLAWPLPLYISGYVFSETAYTLWVGIAVMWITASAVVIILLPLLESRVGILQAVQMMWRKVSELDDTPSHNKTPTDIIHTRRILVAIDGSSPSLRALNYATSLHDDMITAQIYLMYVLEWPEEGEEHLDDELLTKMEREGRILLNSIVLPSKSVSSVRIVRIGDPATKLLDVASKIGASMIVMGTTGLGNAAEMGSVSGKVLKGASVPVVFLK